MDAKNVKPLALLILDGYGEAQSGKGNAISIARTPNMDRLKANSAHTTLSASGLDVGLPDGQMGNSEVGHTNIGAGRRVYQDLPRITKSIQDGSFFKNSAYLGLTDYVKQRGGALHVMGLLSDGGVHSHMEHIFAMLDMAKREGVAEVYVHCFLDGRDVGPKTAVGYIRALQEKCEAVGNAQIASFQGRYWGMDRDKRWDRLEKGYNAIVRGVGKATKDAVESIEASYKAGVTDEFVEPHVLVKRGVLDGDGMVFMNFRPDRAREMCYALTNFVPMHVEVEFLKLDIKLVCTTRYDELLDLDVAYPPEDLSGTFGECVSAAGLKQYRVAETEKYAHVTFFLNGGSEKQYEGEDRELIPSPREAATYDLVPEMSARAVSEALIRAMREGKHELYVCNLANCDMVGHTGNIEATVAAVEIVDECLGLIYAAAKEQGITLIVTSDHGNADVMIDAVGGVYTAHSLSAVPFIIADSELELRSGGSLCDIAPTALSLMGIDKPVQMTGISLIN